jgi:hypothetical protein
METAEAIPTCPTPTTVIFFLLAWDGSASSTLKRADLTFYNSIMVIGELTLSFALTSVVGLVSAMMITCANGGSVKSPNNYQC